MTTTLLAPSMRLANEAIAKRIVAKVRDHSPAPGLLTLAAIMHHASRFCPLGWRTHAVDPSVGIGVRQLAVQRIGD